MYEDHFGLTGRPFQLTPDARFWYETATHRKAMAYLGYGIAQGEGFIVVTGDIGAGKTTLVGHLTGLLDPAALNVITIVSTTIAADDLLRVVATGLGVDPANLTKAQLLTAIERGLHAVKRSGRRTLLIVDEVQALPVDSLEELRMLSNFQAGGHALLQILLLGQPEFRERLQDRSGWSNCASALSPSTTSIRWSRMRSPIMLRTACRWSAGRGGRTLRTMRSRRCTAGRVACRGGSISWPRA